MTHSIVSHEQWLAARQALLQKEKEFNRVRDALSAERRARPWTKVEKTYVFEGPAGKETLAELFAGRSQLMTYHFISGPDWEERCKSCSFLADGFDGVTARLANRDVTLVVVSRAPLAKLQAFKERMGWKFKWVSSYGSSFSHDFHVSFGPEELAKGEVLYNFRKSEFPSDEAPGLSVFCKNAVGEVFHTYSTYARGLDPLIGTYNYLDLAPKGRDEEKEEWTMAWLRHHDRYGT